MKNLIGMTDFVIEQRKIYNGDFEDLADLYFRFAMFLKQPNEKWMFVPCDEDGNVLEEPEIYPYFNCEKTSKTSREIVQCEKYQQAKERCLFEGFRIEDFMITNDKIGIGQAMTLYSDVESLLVDFDSTDIELTQTAIKQLGL
jgi:hypothetical protein